jgi:putative peptidoglycan lipid II flippase
MFAVAVASAALPSLARLRSQGEHEEARETLRYSIRLSLFIAIPASVALAVLAEPTVTVIFGRGAFGTAQALQTARSLVWLAAGVWAVAVSHALTRMYYAYNDTRTPVLCAALNLVTFVVLSLRLAPSWQHVGLAAASTGGAIAQMLLLGVLLRRRTGAIGWGPVWASGLRCCAAAAVMAWVVHDVAAAGDWHAGGNDPRNVGLYAFTAAFGLAVYAAASYLLRAPELGQIAAVLRRRRA